MKSRRQILLFIAHEWTTDRYANSGPQRARDTMIEEAFADLSDALDEVEPDGLTVIHADKNAQDLTTSCSSPYRIHLRVGFSPEKGGYGWSIHCTACHMTILLDASEETVACTLVGRGVHHECKPPEAAGHDSCCGLM
jgi:hypothetical protein